MGDYRDDLERERRRHTMPEDSYSDLERRRDIKRRNRRIGTAALALVIAAVGIGAGLYAFRPSDEETAQPAVTPTITIQPSISPTGPSPSVPSPTPTPPVGMLSGQVSGPIQFIDDQRGWMIDAGGQILSTTDGGHTWSPQPAPTKVTAVNMLAEGIQGWALVEGGGLLETTDGGATWAQVSDQALSTVQFVNSDDGWGVQTAGESGGLLLKTVNGGRTWAPLEQSVSVNSVCFSTADLGWAAGPSETGVSLFKTVDGGATWSETGIAPQGVDLAGYQAAVRCGGDDAWILVAGDGGAGHIAYALFRTAGGDPHAEPVLQDAFTHPLGEGGDIPESSMPQPGPLAARDGQHAQLVAWCPPCGGDVPYVSVEVTQDGGATWTDPTVVDATSPAEPVGITFLDPDRDVDRGWILLHDSQTDTSIVLRTTDGGQTWGQP
jgi:photosystem II stability/assembly factor-like uncharacterized protein